MAKQKPIPQSPQAQKKFGTVMREFEKGSLHSGKSGKVVTNPEQAKAIAANEARRAVKGRRK
jgi:hypothetical protein